MDMANMQNTVYLQYVLRYMWEQCCNERYNRDQRVKEIF